MEVIVLDDSSDASSEGEIARASASTTPPASPAMKWRRTQSVGYADAVEAALAMAAALETKEPSTSRITKKKKKAVLAPPLLPTMAKKLQPKQNINRRSLQTVKDREKTVHKSRGREIQRPAKSSRLQMRSSSLSSSSGSDSSSSSSSGSRSRPRFAVTGAGVGDRPSTASSEKAGLSGRRQKPASSGRHQLEGRRRASSGAQPAVQSKQPAEVVNLMSSSSSSESSVGCRLRSSSESSLTSSDDESPTRTPVKTGKKRLVLNARVTKLKPATFSGSTSAEAVNRPQFPAHSSIQSKSKSLVAGKRKQVLPQMRREIIKKRDRDLGDQLKKKRSHKKKTIGKGARRRDSVSKLSTTTQSAPVSLLTSSSTDSSDSSSSSSTRRPVSARKTVTMPSTASQSTNQAREGETDAFGRYHCRKSVTVDTKKSPGKAKSISPSSASAVSASSVSSPLPSPSPRKKRRTFTYFDTDHVALDDLQAQERELAWIRSQYKQTQNQPRPAKAAAQKRKPCQEVIYMDDHSDTNSTVNSEAGARSDAQQGQSNPKMKLSAAVDRTPQVDPRNAMLHPTSYRGVFFDEAPPNILSSRGQTCSVPFESNCDHPLTFYDETDTLASHCSILESFGKPTQCISSVFPSEVEKPQSDVTRAVSSLVTAHLPIIRRCHRRKVQAILTEARRKIALYQAALKKHKKTSRDEKAMTSHLLPRSKAEKHAVRQLKVVQRTCSQTAGSVSFQIGRGDSFVRERAVSSLIQINRVEETRPLRRYTTSIGLRAHYRVEDDPILRYTAITRPSGTGGGDESGEKYGLQIGNVADEEVAEFVLRLVVGRLGDSEQVFHALKTELGFSQAYTAYCELKKLHDSRQRASTRLDRMEKLRGDGDNAKDPDVAAIVNLLEQSSLSKSSRAKALSRRLQPPICNLESSIVDSLVDGATAGMVTLGLRGTDSYHELVDVYHGSFCRMCYRYACHEHGGDHPLPARRVDPVYPRVQVTTCAAAPFDCSGAASSDEDVICLDDEITGDARHLNTAARVRDGSNCKAAGSSTSKVKVGVESDVDMSDGGSEPQQLRRRQHKTMADPS
ncbi:hypothetical protein F442_05201, partial [Phytophthora nicotianae P10297]